MLAKPVASLVQHQRIIRRSNAKVPTLKSSLRIIRVNPSMVQFFSKQHISWFHTSVAIQTEQQQQKQPTTNKQQFVRPHQPLAPPPGLTNLPFKLDVVTREQLLGGQLLLYTVDKRSMFIMGTVLAVVQFVALGIAAEYTLNYMSSFVGDELVLSPLSSRIALASFFVGVSGLLGLTRWFYGERFIHRVELLPNNQIRVFRYSWFGKSVSSDWNISDIDAGSLIQSQPYWTFKKKGQKFYYVLDRSGSVKQEDVLLKAINGEFPLPQWKTQTPQPQTTAQQKQNSGKKN